MAWPEPSHQSKVFLGLGFLCLAWLARRCLPVFRGQAPLGREFAASLWFLAGLASVVLLARFGHGTGVDSDGVVINKAFAYPWFVVVGTAVAFAFGFLLADRRSVDAPGEA